MQRTYYNPLVLASLCSFGTTSCPCSFKNDSSNLKGGYLEVASIPRCRRMTIEEADKEFLIRKSPLCSYSTGCLHNRNGESLL